jgi:uncharacterized protein (DUF1778 family)
LRAGHQRRWRPRTLLDKTYSVRTLVRTTIQEADVAVKSERLEARVSPDQRARLERAAAISGSSLSAFVVDAAVERADEVVAAQESTTVPADYLDRLVAELDQPSAAPALANAARRAKRRPRIDHR